MKKYVVTVNGNRYEVEVEEVGQGGAISTPSLSPVPATPRVESAPAPAAQPKAEPKKEVAAKPVPQGAETIEAPMPGTILDIKVNEGDSVTEGQVIAVLEAMKMENEIMAPRSGKVSAVNAAKGASVNAGDPIISLE